MAAATASSSSSSSSTTNTTRERERARLHQCQGRAHSHTRGFVDLFVWGVTHELLACVYEASMLLISTVQAAAYYTFIGFWYSPLLWLFFMSRNNMASC